MSEKPVPLSEKIKTAKYVIAHWSSFAPGRSGMYETTKELIKYENRDPEVAAMFINVENTDGGDRDDDFYSQPHGAAYNKATIHAIHRGEPRFLSRLRPKVFFVHGTPEFCLERETSKPEDETFTGSIRAMATHEATIVMAKRHYYMWKPFDCYGRLHYIPKGIDLEAFSNLGARAYMEGKPSVLFGETWRALKSPLMLLYALDEYYKRNPEVLFYPFGVNEHPAIWDKIIVGGRFYKFIGGDVIRDPEALLWPANYYRGASMLICPVNTGEPSRVQMEAMACGCSTIGWDSNPWGDMYASRLAKAFDPIDMANKIEDLWTEIMAAEGSVRDKARKVAEENFSMAKMAGEALKILKGVQDHTI